MRSSLLTLAAAAMLAGPTIAQPAAAQPAPPPPGMGPGADPMGNGTVTRAQAEATARTLFERMDANRDGKLDAADRAARMAGMFDRIDTNHDGTISREEFATAHSRMAPPGAPGMEPGRGHMRGRMGRDRSHGGMDHAGMDNAGPGVPGAEPAPITRDAFVAEGLKRFDAADANHDGKLTREERRAGWRARFGRMRGHGKGGDMPPPPPPPPPPPAGSGK